MSVSASAAARRLSAKRRAAALPRPSRASASSSRRREMPRGVEHIAGAVEQPDDANRGAGRSARRSDPRARGRPARIRAAPRRCAAPPASGRRRSSTAGTRRGRSEPHPPHPRRSTANEMLRSDDPCAIATTLMPRAASAVNTRAAMPGRPGHAVADDGDDRHARPRAVTLSMSPARELVAERMAQRCDRRDRPRTPAA